MRAQMHGANGKSFNDQRRNSCERNTQSYHYQKPIYFVIRFWDTIIASFFQFSCGQWWPVCRYDRTLSTSRALPVQHKALYLVFGPNVLAHFVRRLHVNNKREYMVRLKRTKSDAPTSTQVRLAACSERATWNGTSLMWSMCAVLCIPESSHFPVRHIFARLFFHPLPRYRSRFIFQYSKFLCRSHCIDFNMHYD